MKKFVLFLVLPLLGLSQQNDATTVKDTSYWKKGGVFTFLANQSTFENWQAGGESNISANLNANYDFNYEKGDWVWKNKVIGAYGITKIKNQPEQKTDDRFEFTSNLGKKASGNWYYSLFFNLRTQFDHGVDRASGIRISEFLSPLTIQLGPGMLWKKNDNLRVNIAPATTRVIVVDGKFTENGPSFGVAQGETLRWEFGASVSGYYKFQIMENVTVENILNLYSNYLEDAQNIDVDYQLNIVMKINTYLSTNFAFQTIYDDNAFRGLQTRQVIGLGVNYKLK
jgi:hypothetical protein